MQRLSIIDVAGGHQPISNEDSSLWVVCNGEIYNFLQLKRELQGRGHHFKCQSDSEVLVHLYEEYGDQLVNKISGMYAFAIWDEKRQRLLLARDRLGIKPLYYCTDGKHLLFASELKSLLAHEPLIRTVDVIALSEYLSWGYVPAPRTLLQGIQKLPPAQLLIVENGKVSLHEYWQLRFDVIEERSEDAWAEALRAKIEEAVRSHLVSDVPLGAFLSGGVDSSSIVSLMSRLTERPVQTFSIGFGEGDEYYNELPHAKRVAEAWRTDHHEILVKPDVFDLFPKLIWHLDEPIADSAFVTTYLVSEFARKTVTVILSGVGGDELFGGYRRYLGTEVSRFYNKLPAWLRKTLMPKMAKLLPAGRHSALLNYSRLAKAFVNSSHLTPEASYLSYVSVFGEEARGSLLSPEMQKLLQKESVPCVMQQYLARCDADDPKNLMMFLDIKTQLVDDLLLLTDKMSMAVSLECRVPFLDHELVELAARIPPRLKIKQTKMKYILKKAVGPLLPPEILNRGKRGFGAPVGSWLRRDLRKLSREILSENQIKQRGFFNWPAVKQTLDLHFSGREDHTDHLLSLITFELWSRIYLDGTGRSAPQVTAPMAVTTV